MLTHSCLHISSRQLFDTATKALRFLGQSRSVLPSARAMLPTPLPGHSCKEFYMTSRGGLAPLHARSNAQVTAPPSPAQLRCQHLTTQCSRRHLHASAILASSASPTTLQSPGIQPFPQPAMPGQAAPNNSAIEGRHSLLRRIPLEFFRIAGVSFEGRQEQVANLQQGQVVMLVKEPNNEHDPDAIAVHTLSGHSLGYVPRDFNNKFPHDTNFARVQSVGPSANEEVTLLGAVVAGQPSLPPLTVEAFPASLVSHINMSTALPEQTYHAIRKETYKKASYRCEVTGGVGPQWPVECHEMWRFHDDSCTLQLMGFTALHPSVHAAKHLERQRGVQQRQQALEMLQLVNGWTAAEAEAYWNFAKATAIRRSSQQWKFDLSWLPDHGFEIPQHLQTLCQ